MSKVIRLTESDLTKLVKRVIKEQFNAETQEFKDELASVGEVLSDEEISELQPDCPISSEVPEHSNEIKKFEEKVKTMSILEIKNMIKQLKSQQLRML